MTRGLSSCPRPKGARRGIHISFSALRSGRCPSEPAVALILPSGSAGASPLGGGRSSHRSWPMPVVSHQARGFVSHESDAVHLGS